MVTEAPGIRQTAQQTMQGGDLPGDVLSHLLIHLQVADLLADRLGQPCCSLAGGGSQMNTQWLPGRHCGRLQQPQQAHHCGGLAGPRPAGDDAEGTPRGQRAGQFLPIRLLFAIGEQPVQLGRQVIRQG